MSHFTVVESRMETDGTRRHLVQAPGGTVVVVEDGAGNLFGWLRSGYVATDENEKQIVERARCFVVGSYFAKEFQKLRIKSPLRNNSKHT